MSRTRPQRFSFHKSIIIIITFFYDDDTLIDILSCRLQVCSSITCSRVLVIFRSQRPCLPELYLSGHKSNLSPRHASVNWLTSHIIPFKQYFSLRQCNLTWISRVTLVVVAVHRLNLKLLRALHSPLCLARNKPPPPMMMTEIKTLCRCVCSRLTGTAEW